MAEGAPPSPLQVQAFTEQKVFQYIGFSYGAPSEKKIELNSPARFLHFELYRQVCDRLDGGPPSDAEQASLGGREGLLLPANGLGAYFGNHVRFFFSESGASYVATLHDFGPDTVALLEAILEGVRPVGKEPPQRILSPCLPYGAINKRAKK
jgi:hypothetical protein